MRKESTEGGPQADRWVGKITASSPPAGAGSSPSEPPLRAGRGQRNRGTRAAQSQKDVPQAGSAGLEDKAGLEQGGTLPQTILHLAPSPQGHSRSQLRSAGAGTPGPPSTGPAHSPWVAPPWAGLNGGAHTELTTIGQAPGILSSANSQDPRSG